MRAVKWPTKWGDPCRALNVNWTLCFFAYMPGPSVVLTLRSQCLRPLSYFCLLLISLNLLFVMRLMFWIFPIVQVVLLGDADEIVQYLCGRLGKGWTLPPPLAEEEDPQLNSKEQRGLTGPSKVAGAAVGEPPSLKNKSSARSISSGGASGNTSSSATKKAKGKAEDKIQGADVPMAEPTRIGARYVIFFCFSASLWCGGETCCDGRSCWKGWTNNPFSSSRG